MTKEERMRQLRQYLSPEAIEEMLAALTAPPPPPRVDVRKVYDWLDDRTAMTPRMALLAAALRAAGCEVVE